MYQCVLELTRIDYKFNLVSVSFHARTHKQHPSSDSGSGFMRAPGTDVPRRTKSNPGNYNIAVYNNNETPPISPAHITKRAKFLKQRLLVLGVFSSISAYKIWCRVFIATRFGVTKPLPQTGVVAGWQEAGPGVPYFSALAPTSAPGPAQAADAGPGQQGPPLLPASERA